MSRTWKSRVGVLALAATMGIGIVGVASPAFAGGGNSANALACQQNGWKTQFRSDGTGFKNTGDCVSYAAQGGQFVISSCLKSSLRGHFDLLLTRPINTFANVVVYASFDGTCSGAALYRLTIVSASDAVAAEAECAALNPAYGGSVYQLNPTQGYPVPSNWWHCNDATPV